MPVAAAVPMFGAQAAAGGAGFGGVFGRPKLERRIATMQGLVTVVVNGQDVEITLHTRGASLTFQPVVPALFGLNDLQDRIIRARGPCKIRVAQGNLHFETGVGGSVQFHQ